MPPALALAGATLAGSLISSKGSRDSAKIQAKAGDQAGQLVRDSYLDTEETLDPYTQSGIPALNRRNVLMGLEGTPEQRSGAWRDVYSDPVLTEQNQLVTDAVDRGASAGGMKNSGNRLAALSDRLQRIKYDFGQQYLNRLDTSVNTGFQSAAATGGVAANAANTQSQIIRDVGRSSGQAKEASASAFGSGLADISAIYANRDDLSELYKED